MLDEGKKAVTIRVDDVLGVGGFVQPDDRVDVLLTRTARGASEGREGSAYTDLLLQDIRVLAIDQFADRDAKAKPAKTVTVEVTTEDAQKACARRFHRPAVPCAATRRRQSGG